MDYKLILGILLTITFTWFLVKSIKRYGFPKGLLAVDIIVGIFAGLYLLVTSIYTLIVK